MNYKIVNPGLWIDRDHIDFEYLELSKHSIKTSSFSYVFGNK